MSADTPQRPFLRLLLSLLHDTGRRLWELRAASLGAWVLSATEDSAAGKGGCGDADAAASRFVARLAAALPGFRDPPLHSKAVRLAVDLRRRYVGGEHGARFFSRPLDVSSASLNGGAARRCTLPAPADGPLLRALLAADCVSLRPPPAAADGGRARKAGGVAAAEAAARAACVAAVAAVAAAAAAAPDAPSEPEVAAWLVAKHAEAQQPGAKEAAAGREEDTLLRVAARDSLAW